MMDMPEVQAEIDKATYLYETAYPGYEIDLYLSQSNDVVPPRARVVEGHTDLREWEMAPGYLGLFQVGQRGTHAFKVSVFISLPRKPNPAEYKSHGQPRVMVSRKARLLFKTSPLALEYAKYVVEQRHIQKRYDVHGWDKLQCARDFVRPDPSAHDVRPSILIGFHWLEHGGAEKLALDTVHWALEAGLRVFVVSELDGLHRVQDKLPDHPDVVFLRTDRYLPADQLARFFMPLILRENIKAIHIHHYTPIYEILPSIKSQHADITVIDSTHIVEHHDGGFVRIAGVWSNFVDVHHVISHELETVFLDKFQVRDKVVLGRLLDHDRTAAARAPFSLEAGQDKITIAFVGRMAHQKRPTLVALQMKALAAWAIENDVKIDFQIVGEGPHLEIFKALLARYNLAGISTLHEANTDVPALLAQSDILLLPSSNEGLALVCYEAIEQGVVPISSDVGAQSELIPESLLTSANPLTSIKQTVSIVETLLQDKAALDAAKTALGGSYETVSQDPKAYDVLMPIYTAAGAA